MIFPLSPPCIYFIFVIIEETIFGSYPHWMMIFINYIVQTILSKHILSCRGRLPITPLHTDTIFVFIIYLGSGTTFPWFINSIFVFRISLFRFCSITRFLKTFRILFMDAFVRIYHYNINKDKNILTKIKISKQR